MAIFLSSVFVNAMLDSNTVFPPILAFKKSFPIILEVEFTLFGLRVSPASGTTATLYVPAFEILLKIYSPFESDVVIT